jgi:hypothetical protein
MNPEQLIPGESILTTSENNLIVLTTHRVRYSYSEWGQANTISIMLEKISSIQARYISYPLLLVAGGVAILVAFFIGSNRFGEQAPIVPTAIGIGCIIWYFMSRKHFCIITSDGGAKIAFSTDGVKREVVVSMIDKIEAAKSKRTDDLTKR